MLLLDVHALADPLTDEPLPPAALPGLFRRRHQPEPPAKRRRIDPTEDSACLVRVRLQLRFAGASFPAAAPDSTGTGRSNVLLKSASDLHLTFSSPDKPATDVCVSFTSHQLSQPALLHLQAIAKVASRDLSTRKPDPTPLWSRVVLLHPTSIEKDFSVTNEIILEAQLFWKLGLFSERKSSKRRGADLGAELLRTYFPQESEVQTSWLVKDFYDVVHVPPMDSQAVHDIPEGLMSCQLYPFQARTVNWLLERENFDFADKKPLNVGERSSQELPLSFYSARDYDGSPCLVSHLRRIVISDITGFPKEEDVRGGILAEEMGLGKTIELAMLICLHRRTLHKRTVYDAYTDSDVAASGATLIITPPSILDQWMNELNRNAPHLKVHHYKGIGTLKEEDEEHAIQDLLGYDVVLTTYNILSREIHFANTAPSRDLRYAKVYKPRRSPLVQISWWRCCLDEAQMIETGVSAAAIVARQIPRINAWAVSGTPLRKNLHDLFGLLIFLRQEPFCSNKALWDCIDKRTFKELFSRIALRHSKDQIRHELHLPPQRRIIMRMPFSAIEQANYDQLLQQLHEECGLTPEGAPAREDCDVSPERLRPWLTRLRQVCLHPQVGGRNRRALGRGNGPLRTVREVLDVMIEQNDVQVRAEQRDHILAQVQRAHIICNARDNVQRSQHALGTYMSALNQAESIVDEIRRELATEESTTDAKQSILAGKGASDNFSDVEDQDDEQSKHTRNATLRKALRYALEVQHICAFFVATAYYLTKTNKDLTKPETEDSFELLEAQYYDKAKSIRKELLRESHSKSETIMRKISLSKNKVIITAITDFEDYGGIESRRVLDKLDHLVSIMDKQGQMLGDLRANVVATLLLPLIDEDEGNETTGAEYEESTQAQDKLQVHLTVLRAVLADRNLALTGQPNYKIRKETEHSQNQAKEGRGPCPELLLRLYAERDRLKPTVEGDSLRSVISELKSIATSLDGSAANKNTRAMAELAIVEKQLDEIQRVSSQELKRVLEFEKELELYRNGMNARVEFYRQLQHISDTVAPYKEDLDENLDRAALDAQVFKESKAADRVASLKTKQRFLLNLRKESDEQQGPRLCVICQSTFDLGVLTVCGHQFCKDCITFWYRDHKNCPLCKRKLSLRDFYEVSLKGQELRAHEESQPTAKSSVVSAMAHSSIYSEMSQAAVDEIKAVELEASFGTKIDTLCKHILWIRESDPGSKSIVFSTHGDFFTVLQDAFRKFKIGFSSVGQKGGTERFKADVAIEAFLLDAKTDASGLNLTCATHVFICEPLINTAIELQAIARVHRIGQQRATTVYCYIVAGSVEERIYALSVERRTAHLQRVDERAVEAAEALELQQAPNVRALVEKKGGGEVVGRDDVFRILFGA
ncbi:uncharacterized protein K452DRAFT_287641 [Aplosporella prunicola CBS 121167]|uniref:RING-type domain-containing protein n=1 Tax=Aplosporella prunicola CBS 121167 TaxID=1176127 RepID=A0A6A6BEF2_9PEZI|nr:uncharacterized protein K452DRAFT_287641 [Aplosporella prunicola CBS 121167]KAF2141685.1 hypothetical protein K452DRAFT_287641 [Aplosporella prunicola CBS 121167]